MSTVLSFVAGTWVRLLLVVAVSLSPDSTGADSVGINRWCFDDSMSAETRGQPLTAEMLASKGGYTFVSVGDVGVVVAPGKNVSVRSRAVRTCASISADGSVSSSTVSGQRGVPCPAQLNQQHCQQWCKAVVPAGEVRAELRSAAGNGWQCVCQDAASKIMQAMCRRDLQNSTKVPSGVASLANSAISAARKRFFLYDVKYGEGFNLQREVYPRAGWIVSELNKDVQQRCHGQASSGDCALWTLVLPPWCRVVHWWSGPEHLPWSTFFDMGALHEAKIPIMEFADYVKQVGGQRTDLVIMYTTEDKKGKTNVEWQGSYGEFQGFAKDVADCEGKVVNVPEYRKVDHSSDLDFVYAGQCRGGIMTTSFKCGKINGPWPRGIVDMLRSLNGSIGSVLVKGYDYLLAPDNKELDAIGLRESMIWSKDIRDAADDFIATTLNGRAYVAAHCRRTDFIRVRKATTPDASAIADKLNELLKQTGFDQVFVATDAPDDLRQDLQAKVRGKVHFYDEIGNAKKFDLPGQMAAVEMWIASRADFFIGSIESRFTMWIQLERGFLGKGVETSEQEFCKEYSDAKKKCLAPKYRHPLTRGKHRDAYQRA